MISQQQIDETVTWQGLNEFASFVLAHAVQGGLADYETMNLMRIPRLVPHLFVYDLRTRDGRSRLLMNFAGSQINDLWGENSLGKYDIDRFAGNPVLEAVGRHRLACIDARRPGYSQRFIQLETETNGKKFKYTESLFFPCSSDRKTVNWSIGCAYYDLKPFDGADIFRQL
ncbi:MAG: hypothetical protein HQ483_06365 [Rhodospirillales bacterium]|nr:hypothetical protein [Rhodospirillales bacterium]